MFQEDKKNCEGITLRLETPGECRAPLGVGVLDMGTLLLIVNA